MGGEEKSTIRQFYKDKSVFVTGATGFMGKVMIIILCLITKKTLCLLGFSRKAFEKHTGQENILVNQAKERIAV